MFLPVLAPRKLTAKLVGHRFTLNYSMHFFSLQKENIIIEENLKILILEKNIKTTCTFSPNSKTVTVNILLHFLKFYF